MSSGDPILVTTGLSKRFGGVKAIDSVDFRLERGELRCLIGPNGAGKSTFFKMLTGQYKPTSGTILFDGRDTKGAQPHEYGRRGIGIKNQVPDVMDGLSVAENLWLASRFSHRGEAVQKAVDEIFERLALGPIRSRLVGELAHGQRQWVEMGMVVVREPTLVLLDEPAAGMSDEEGARTAQLIREINRRAAVIVVEHDMQFIRRIASKVTVFNQGRILLEDTFDRVINNQTVREVYLGRGTNHHA